MISRYHIDVCVCVYVCACVCDLKRPLEEDQHWFYSVRETVIGGLVTQNCGYAHALCLTEVGRGHVMGMKKWGKDFW